MFPVDTSYRKDLKHRAGYGYGRLVGAGSWTALRSTPMTSIVVHSTNGRKGSSLDAEARFLRDSADVSCHDLIGKDGTVIEILPPSMVAWHAGTARAEFHNLLSCGIELHHAVGDTYPDAQIAALTWRVLQRIAQFTIRKERIDTHRAIALPAGRKVDPSDWSDADFYEWRERLYEPDWKAEWGTLAYYPDHGIETKWREHYRELGRCVLTEKQLIDGRRYAIFERGAVVWSPDGRTEVWR